MAAKHKDAMFDLLSQKEDPVFNESNRYSGPMKFFRQKCKGKNKEEIKTLFDSVFDNYGEKKDLVSEVRRQWAEELTNLRLFCVCEINDNLLLWSHYADHHRGVAVQFECLKELDVPLLAAVPVIYSDEAPGMATEEEWIKGALGLAPMNAADVAFGRIIGTKARVWEHEKEWRVVGRRRPYENVGFEDCPFDPQEISKIFLGCNISEDDRKSILALLAGPFAHVQAYSARQHPQKFKIEFERIN